MRTNEKTRPSIAGAASTHDAAVRARVEICLLAIARGVESTVIAQTLDELADEVRDRRAARLRTIQTVPIALRMAPRASSPRRRRA